jgi:hypothetical protein
VRLFEEARESGEDLGGGEEKDFSIDDTLAETMKGLKMDDEPTQAQALESALAAPVGRAPPKAWKSEMHPHWGKLSAEVQDYLEQRENEVSSGFEKHRQEAEFGRQFSEAINPYLPDIQQWGVQPTQAVQALLNAHRTLKSSDAAQRQAMFEKLARDYGVNFTPVEQEYVDPAVKELLERQTRLESAINSERQAKLDTLRNATDKEVSGFFADKTAHPYAEEVADQIVLLLADPRVTLANAYEQAVYANPSTRAKELARLSKETEEKLRKEKEAEAEEARKKRGTRVRGSTEGSPHREPLGDMDSTLKATLKEIKERERTKV